MFIFNVFAGVQGPLAPAFAGVRGAAAPCFMVWTMDYGPWSIFIGLWSMVHFGHHFPGKIARSIVFYSTSVPARNSEPDEPDEPETVSASAAPTSPALMTRVLAIV